jgi:Uncharacterised nucleotidyltransferase
MPEHERELAQRLLSLCLSPPPSRSEAAPQPSSLHTDNWDALIGFAIRQGVAPLLAVRTRHLPVPVPFRERLESIYSANSIRNLRFAAEESRLCAAFTGAGLRRWPLKGPGLSEHLYADIGVRQVSDLDFLIEPANLAQTDALLAGLGYQRQTQGAISSLTRAQELLYVRDIESPLAFHLDLHQGLLPYVRRDTLAARVFAEGMTSENLLLYLCANQVTHRFARLRYVCDVAACLDREGSSVNWNRFVETARKMAWGPGIGLSLQWAAEFSPARVPPSVMHTLRPGRLGDLLLRRALGADAADAASRTLSLDGPGGASVVVGAAYAGAAQLHMAWRLAFPTEAYLREQSGAPSSHTSLPAYAGRIARRIPAALRHLLRNS